MFITEDKPSLHLRPVSSEIDANDWEILSKYWYPLAVDSEVLGNPVPVTLLDVDLVIYRTDEGITVARDLCPHRYIRLSAGKMEANNIVCPFHGLAFNGRGQCVKVPALGREAKLPASYSVRTFRTETKYGLIWACLDDQSTETIPTLPETETALAEKKLVFGFPTDWPVSAARQIENFIDLAHLPIVHASTVKADDAEPMPPAYVEETNEGLLFTADLIQNESRSKMEYRLILPFTVDFRLFAEGLDFPVFHNINFATPSSAHACRVFILYLMDNPTGSDRPQVTPYDIIVEEDIEILGFTAIADLPLNQKHEIHLPVDNVSIAFRRRLRDLGLGRR